MSGWDVAPGAPLPEPGILSSAKEQVSKSSPVDPLADMAGELADLIAKRKDIDVRIEALELTFAQRVPDTLGEHPQQYGTTLVTVKRGERIAWDSDILEKMFASVPLPDHVDHKFAIKKRAFDRLSDDEKAALLPAMERKPTVSVTAVRVAK